MDCVDIDALGLLRVTGPQNTDFLQGQLSCDVTNVTPTRSCLTTHCNFKGRLLASGQLFQMASDYYLVVPAKMISFLLNDLNQYAAFYRVTLEDVSVSIPKLGCIGTHLAAELSTLFATDALAANSVVAQEDKTLLSIPGVLPRAILFGNVTWARSQPMKSFSHWQMIDIKSGIPHITPETRGRFTPHHLNYHQLGGVSFTKGCYTGQEVIARMHYLGKLQQGLYQLRFTSAVTPALGSDIIDGQSNVQGTLVAAGLDLSHPNGDTYQALAVIQHTSSQIPLYCMDSAVDYIQPMST